jgi:glucosamine--fructose-6-phosphate aminotransferase (isomerizing)
MCGIVAYLGASQAADILLGGLTRLEYRGYDSAGIAVMQGKPEAPDEAPAVPLPKRQRSASGGHRISTVKRAGKVAALSAACTADNSSGTLGVGHTRWATHGPPTDANAHPHTSSDGSIAVVHNGIVENFAALRAELVRKGYVMQSDTDTELLAHLIFDVRLAKGGAKPMPLEEAVRQALTQVHGAFGLAVICVDEPDMIVGARKGSPLILGIGEDEYLLASDASAVVEHTKHVVYLNDNEMAVLTRSRGYQIKTLDNVPRDHNLHT